MSIPLILASKSKSRRDLLFNAGVCPTIRVSHVDEDAALEKAAAEADCTVDDLGIDEKVMILAEAKAFAVYDAYRAVAEASRKAHGEQVTGYPLKAADQGNDAEETAEDRADARTRDFSGVDIPKEIEALADAMAQLPGLTDTTTPGPLILGCDSMFLLDGKAYGKPHTPEVARERLREMSGATGELWTSHCLIDFATGHVAKGASKATIHFCEFDDDMIEKYIATGEPLEVAGSFTLDGFGGAFIDGIEGDPSGIVGLSLPLARQLTEQLGLKWTDLWNVTRGERIDDTHPDLGKDLPPKENVHQPGDGWVECACGRRHWGTNGAAGVLLARRDPKTGEPAAIVMQHRAKWSAEGGTWGIPGGAIADGESPIEGALRESYEEANITPEDIEVVGTYREDHGPWAYTTVFAFEKPGHEVTPRANDDESMEIEWVPLDEVPNRKLLTAMRTDWPSFARRLQQIAAGDGEL
ncbi:MAG: Maf family protein [Bifidobacterium sp.]|nr:Maf family protein [Bifidobacterium sp.]